MKENKFIEKAKELAAKEYVVRVYTDEASDGEIIFMATNPELDGCMAQGETAEEALSILDEVRVDYFAHLIEYGLPIPEPAETITEINNTLYFSEEDSVVQNIGISGKEFDEILSRAIQPNKRKILFEASLKT